jgi:hypothetical protein
VLRAIMYGKPGWFILHAVAFTLVFLLGYSARF